MMLKTYDIDEGPDHNDDFDDVFVRFDDSHNVNRPDEVSTTTPATTAAGTSDEKGEMLLLIGVIVLVSIIIIDVFIWRCVVCRRCRRDDDHDQSHQSHHRDRHFRHRQRRRKTNDPAFRIQYWWQGIRRGGQTGQSPRDQEPRHSQGEGVESDSAVSHGHDDYSGVAISLSSPSTIPMNARTTITTTMIADNSHDRYERRWRNNTSTTTTTNSFTTDQDHDEDEESNDSNTVFTTTTVGTVNDDEHEDAEH